MKKTVITLTAIIAILIMELYAISNGLDGVVLSAAAAIISGLGGYQVAKKQETE